LWTRKTSRSTRSARQPEPDSGPCRAPRTCNARSLALPQQPLVFSVSSDPTPKNALRNLLAKGSMLESDANRPISRNPFQCSEGWRGSLRSNSKLARARRCMSSGRSSIASQESGLAKCFKSRGFFPPDDPSLPSQRGSRVHMRRRRPRTAGPSWKHPVRTTNHGAR